MRKMVMVAALAAFVTTAGLVLAAPGPGAVGTAAKDFALQEYGLGTTHTLSQHQGEVVLLFIIGYG